MRYKHQLQIPSRIGIGNTAVRVYGSSLWNKTSNIIAQYHFKKCYWKQLKKFSLSKYTVN